MAGKIPVTVVSGFLGSGKTTLLNHLLAQAQDTGDVQARGRTVVLINELGAVSLDHERFLQLDDHIVLLESGCICCAVRGDLVNALRQLFLDALHRKIPPFSALLIETTGIADPAPVIYTLQYERFLADRYAYAGCLTVVDGVYGAGQLQRYPEAVQQLVLADVLAISKADQASPEHLSGLRRTLQGLNPAAPVLLTQELPGMSAVLAAVAEQARIRLPRVSSSLWAGRAMVSPAAVHMGVGVLMMQWNEPWIRSGRMRGLSELLAGLGEGLLRLKGRVHFQGEAHASALHAVHQHLYPVEAIAAPHAGAFGADAGQEADGDNERPVMDGASVLLFIHRGLDEDCLLKQIHALLPGGERVLSPDGNFIQ